LRLQIRKNSDTEVILKAFHKWHVQSIAKFTEMFAFGIFDLQAKIIFMVHDRVGAKPLYYYHDQHGLVFASDIQTLNYYPHYKRELSQYGLQLYLQYGYIHSPWTIYDGVKKLNPGTYLIYDISNKAINEGTYWDLTPYYHFAKFGQPESDITEQLHSKLLTAFQLRMLADVPVGILLSCSIDSSLVAALLQANSSKPLDSLTIYFDQRSFDKSEYAKKTANNLGTCHHQYLCTVKEAEHILYQLPAIYSDPFADISAISTALVPHFAKQYVEVVLSGDGGDELFADYQS
jgi:asparagine synthase (glutamine-hydrolysing)